MRLWSLYFRVAGAVGVGDYRLLAEAFFDDVGIVEDEFYVLSSKYANFRNQLQGMVRDGPPLFRGGNPVEPEVYMGYEKVKYSPLSSGS